MTDRLRELEDIVRKSPAVCFVWSAAEGWPVEFVTDNVSQFGYSPEDFLSGNLRYASIVHPDDLAGLRADVSRCCEQGESELSACYRIRTGSGEARMVEDHTQVRRDASGAVTHFQGIVLDVTERHRAQVELEHANRTLEVLRARTMRLAAEDALRESEEKYRTVLEHSHDGIFMAQDDVIVFCNRALASMLGMQVEELQGRAISEIIVPEDLDLVLGRHRQRIEGVELPESYEFRALHRDGVTPVLVHMSVGLCTYLGRKATVGTVRDVTQERMQEIALRESESKYRSVIENIQDAFYRSDAQGRLIMASPSLVRLLGYESLDECLNVDISTAYADPGARQELLRTLLERGVISDYEVTLLRRDGTPIVVATSSRLRLDEHGEFLGVEGIFRDVTQSKRAEAALRESEERLQRFLRGSPIPCFVIGPDHRVVLWNDALAELTNVPAEQVIGTRDHWRAFYDVPQSCLADLLVAGDSSAMAVWHGGSARRSTLIDEAFVGMEFFPMLRKGGRWLHYTAAAVRDRSGVLIGAIETIEDVTELRRADEQLRRSQRLESIGRLAAGVAHDFNNMLTPIMGYAGFLLASLQPLDERHGHAEQILRAAQRSRDLTRQLLAFSRKQVLDLKAIDLREIVSGLQNLLRRTLREDIELRIGLAAEVCPILADVGQIEQVLMNLTVNAQDAMPGGGMVALEVGIGHTDALAGVPVGEIAPGPCVVLTVSDTGTGMDEETREHVFEPFFTTKVQGAGTGLGLATVHGIVKQHGGVIVLETSPGAGSTFRILLPLGTSIQRSPAEQETTPSRFARPGETLLVVEDSKPVLDFAVAALEGAGYRVLSAGSGGECLQMLASYQGALDLLLTDVVMPNMNGRELSERARQVFPGLRTLYMSGYPQDVIDQQGILEAGVRLLRKPFTIQELTTSVRDAIESPRAGADAAQGPGDSPIWVRNRV